MISHNIYVFWPNLLVVYKEFSKISIRLLSSSASVVSVSVVVPGVVAAHAVLGARVVLRPRVQRGHCRGQGRRSRRRRHLAGHRTARARPIREVGRGPAYERFNKDS